VLVVLFGAYFAAIVYACTLPAKSRFSTEFSKINVIGFFQQAFYIFGFLTLLMPFISGWGSFFLVLFLYVIIFVPTVVNLRLLGRDFTFEEYVKFHNSIKFEEYVKSHNIIELYNRLMPMIWKLSGIALLWLVLLGELIAFLYWDPTIPLIGWAIILYSLAVALLQTALAQSYFSNVHSCPYAKIITVDGPLEGFIIAKGSDHYIVKTKENDILLSNEYVKSISPSPLPK
jgi:hypothetical protein